MRRSFQKIRILIPAALLLMILTRMVWIQLRSYEFSIDPGLVSHVEAALNGGCWDLPALIVRGELREWCFAEPLDLRWFATLNQSFLYLSVLLCALAVRFLTSSWILSLATAAVLLSRGRLLADLGRVSFDHMIACAICLWLAATCHFLRTASRISLVVAGTAGFLAMILDVAAIGVLLSFPLLLTSGFLLRRRLSSALIRRLRVIHRSMRRFHLVPKIRPEHRGETPLRELGRLIRWSLGLEYLPPSYAEEGRLSYQRGSLFRPMEVPFALWISTQRRWVSLTLFWLALAALGVVLFVVGLTLDGEVTRPLFSPEWLSSIRVHSWLWLQASWQLLDAHLAGSLVVLILCAIQPPDSGVLNFLEACWLLILSLVGVTFCAWVTEGMGTMGVSSRNALIWFEPVLLGLGMAGIHNLLQVVSRRPD